MPLFATWIDITDALRCMEPPPLLCSRSGHHEQDKDITYLSMALTRNR
jgi:hypothetical protein